MRLRDLKAIRKQLGLSQEALAKALDVTRSTVNRWEAGVSPVPKAIGLAVLYLKTTLKTP